MIRPWTVRKRAGQYGNRFVRVGNWLEAQISGHDHLTELRIFNLELWFKPTTGEFIHWRMLG